MTIRLRLSLLPLAALLVAPACIITADDDDGSDSANDSSNPPTSAGTGSTAPETAETAGTAASADSAGTAATADDTASGGACGWGPTGDDMVPEGYVCGGDGADPNGMFQMDCPADVTLEMGAECGGIEGPGCCDADGNVWFCGNDGEGPALVQITC